MKFRLDRIKVRRIGLLIALIAMPIALSTSVQAQPVTQSNCTVTPYPGIQISDRNGVNRVEFKIKVSCTGFGIVDTRQRGYEVNGNTMTPLSGIAAFHDIFPTGGVKFHWVKVAVPNTPSTEIVVQKVSIGVLNEEHPNGQPWTAWTPSDSITVT